MIKFEITESPDADVKATFEFFQNMIYLGRTSGNLQINDPFLLKSHLLIEVVGTDVIAHPQKEVEHYLINGKRSTHPRKIRVSDVITIGKTTLKILAFEETRSPTRKSILNQKLQELIDSNSHRLPVIEALSKMSK